MNNDIRITKIEEHDKTIIIEKRSVVVDGVKREIETTRIEPKSSFTDKTVDVIGTLYIWGLIVFGISFIGFFVYMFINGDFR